MPRVRNRVYYRLKPFVPQSVRTALRRRLVSRLRDSVGDVWPIMPDSARQPEGWPGWPDGKKFALVLTHDVETIRGLERCRQLMELELELGVRSSFNFVPEGEYRVPENLRHELTQNGFEIGIHDLKHDGRLYESRRRFGSNATVINRYLAEWGAVGFRSAFMLNRLDWLPALNIEYDASTFDTDPFEPQPQGQQTIFPFWVSGPPIQKPQIRGRKSDQISDLCSQNSHSSRGGYMELPYTLPQDSTLFLLLQENTPEIWFRKLEWIAEHGGMAMVITHPDYMNFGRQGSPKNEYPVDLYRQFIEHVQAKYSGEYWLALPKQVAAYVRRSTFGARDSATGSSNGSRLSGENGIFTSGNRWRLRGKRAAAVVFSYYPADPRPRRAAEALHQQGVDLDLICLRKDKSEPVCETDNGIRVIRIPVKRERGGKWSYIRQYSLFIFRTFAYLTAQSLRRRYDFIHVHNMPDVLVFSAIVPKLLGARILLDLHDPVPELMQTIFDLPGDSPAVRILRRLEKWSTRFANHVITVNEACRRIYAARSCPADKITVVVNSPDESVFGFRSPSLNGNGRKTFNILYHGSLLPRNGFDLAVDALAKIRRSIPEPRLVVCGESTPFFAETMDMAVKRGLANHIEYRGVKNRAGIAAVIAECDVGVVPNRRSLFAELNTPTRIFECLALGKPVIAPRTPGICDYFRENDLVFFELGNADDLARRLEFVYFDPEKTKTIIECGQNVYRAHSWQQQRAKLLDTVSGLL